MEEMSIEDLQSSSNEGEGIMTETNSTEEKARRKNGNKTVRCIICNRCMRSDHLKQHMHTHKDIIDMTDEEVREELRERQTLYEQRTERVKEIAQISQDENISRECCRDLMTLGVFPKRENDTREKIILLKQEYLEKIELGKEVVTCIIEEDIPEDSLSIEHKEALDLYKKQMPRVNTHFVQLKPW